MSIFLLANDQYQKVSKFFPADFPDVVVVYAILEKRMPGEVWVDNSDEPSAVLIKTQANICYITGHVEKKLFKQFLKQLRSNLKLHLVFEPSPNSKPFNLFLCGLTHIDRLSFKLKDKTKNYLSLPTTSAFDIVPLDKTNEKIFRTSSGFSIEKKLYGSEEKCIEEAYGFAVWDKQKNRIASETLGVSSNDYVELGIATHPDYRRQHLAKIVCGKFIVDILESKREPLWACKKSNEASIKLANSLGFEIERKYQFHIFLVYKFCVLAMRIVGFLKRKTKNLRYKSRQGQ
jgi:RimJ/RimL family protein N-acetyltransferase